MLPLSIAYLDGDGTTVDALDMEPCPPATGTCPTYPPSAPYRSALEVPQGGLEPLGLEPGSPARLEVTGACVRARHPDARRPRPRSGPLPGEAGRPEIGTIWLGTPAARSSWARGRVSGGGHRG